MIAAALRARRVPHDARQAERIDRRLTVCFPFAGDAIGGSHVSVLGLMKHLDITRFRTIVVPEIRDGHIARHFAGYEQMPDPAADGRSFVPGEAFSVAKFARTLTGIVPRVRFLRAHKIDIVHVNDGRTSAQWAVAARLAGARLVWHNRGDPNALGLRFVAPLLAHKVLTVSSFALPRPGRWSAAHKAEVVHSPFDTDVQVDRAAARAMLANELGISSDTLILGFFGAFVPRKRPLIFIDTVIQLRGALNRPVVGVMFGKARVAAMDRIVREHISRSGASDSVRQMGYRTPGAYWIGACDQLIVPAVGEPFGRTLVEAMLVGTPVVAARSGGNIEAIGGGLGILVQPDDAAAFASACARLANDSAGLAEMTVAAARDARHRFSARHHCEQVAEVYDKVVPER